MAQSFSYLTPQQLNALKAVATVGSVDSAAVLSEMVNKKISMTVPDINVVPLNQVADIVGGPEILVTGIYTRVEGQAPCSVLFLFPGPVALSLARLLLDQTEGTVMELDFMARSALLEMANVVGGAYLNALSKFTNLDFIPCPPVMASDMAGAILDTILIQIDNAGDEVLLLETEFSYEDASDDEKIRGHFFLLPEGNSLKKILKAIGVKN